MIITAAGCLQSLYFQSLNFLVLVCVSSILRLTFKKKKRIFCAFLQNAACILASSDPLFHDLAFSIFFWNLQAEGKGGGHPPLHLKFFKLKRGLLMNSPFANGKVDSVELILRSFPIFRFNFVFYSCF